MGCLFVILLGALSAAAFYFIGYPDWLLTALGLLWLAAVVFSALRGHVGFGGHGNTDLQIVLAGVFIAAAIVLPKYAAQKHCDEAKMALRELAQAEVQYFAAHKTYTADLAPLKLAPDPNIQVGVTRADERSFSATASHRLCSKKDDSPELFVWDSSRGGMQ